MVSAPGYTPIVIHKVTASSYTNGATSFQSATAASTTTSATTQQQQVVSTNLNGDKVGKASNDIYTHSSSTFNPNVKIVIGKNGKPSPTIQGSGKKTSIKEEQESVTDVLDEVEDSSSKSTTFILIAGIVIVLVFVTLFVSKMMLQKKVLKRHAENFEIRQLQDAKFKAFSGGQK